VTARKALLLVVVVGDDAGMTEIDDTWAVIVWRRGDGFSVKEAVSLNCSSVLRSTTAEDSLSNLSKGGIADVVCSMYKKKEFSSKQRSNLH